MKIIFSHGKESGPWGFKIKRLAELAKQHGHEIDSIDYTDTMDQEIRADRLIKVLEKEQGDVALVGSSMGGYVSLVASCEYPTKGVFLMAPALYIPGWAKQDYPTRTAHLEIVHGWSDEIIPVDLSIRYAKQADCTLHLISGDHGLNGVIDEVSRLFEGFLSRL